MNQYYMNKVLLNIAIFEAVKGLLKGGVPIGSVLVYKGKVIGYGHNKRIQKSSVILHGEMDALENAGRLPAKVYKECTLYTTLAPCAMCAGAILLYGIPKVIIGENKTFAGEVDLLRSNGVEVIVLNDKRCIDIMTKFRERKPKIWNEDIGV